MRILESKKLKAHHFQVEIVVSCIRETESTQTHREALRLLAQMAKLFRVSSLPLVSLTRGIPVSNWLILEGNDGSRDVNFHIHGKGTDAER